MKEASTLADAGYQVEVIGGWFDRNLKARDQELLPQLNFRYTPVLDLVENSGATRFKARLQRRLGEIGQQRGLENSWQLGYFSRDLRRAARRSTADLLIAHSEQAMAAIAPVRDTRLGVDLEDWFSEDGQSESGVARPVQLLRSLENKLLNRGKHSSCTSKAMSQRLAATFGCRPPTVIYNTFRWADRSAIDGQFKDRKDLRRPSLHWFSQTLGKARGLEDLFRALPHLSQKIEIHLRGKPLISGDALLNEYLPNEWRSQVFVHDLVSNDDLLSRIAEHDIGFSGDSPYCANREATISNKVFQYLLAGLAVVASDTAGHREVAEQSNGALTIYEPGNPLSLAAALNELLDYPGHLKEAKHCALRAAENPFCWERQRAILVESVGRALAT
jgi:glycosyltransferase involved in cell wall biosynthesis